MIAPDVYCVACGAQPGKPCKSGTGNTVRTHASREMAARDRQRALVLADVAPFDLYRARRNERAAQAKAAGAR